MRDRFAGSLGDEFPVGAVVIDFRRAGAGRAGTGRAVVLALERDAKAFVLARRIVGGGGGGLRGEERERGRESAGERSGGDRSLGGLACFLYRREREQFELLEPNASYYACLPAGVTLELANFLV